MWTSLYILSIQIPIIEDLPVGQNLQDHIFFPLLFYINESTMMDTMNPMSIAKYIMYGTGKAVILKIVFATPSC